MHRFILPVSYLFSGPTDHSPFYLRVRVDLDVVVHVEKYQTSEMLETLRLKIK